MCLLYDLFILEWKTYVIHVNVPTVSNKQKKIAKILPYFLLASWKPLTKRAGSGSNVGIQGFGSVSTFHVSGTQLSRKASLPIKKKRGIHKKYFSGFFFIFSWNDADMLPYLFISYRPFVTVFGAYILILCKIYVFYLRFLPNI